MNDLISRKALLAEYDRVHIGEPGKARKLIEDAPAIQKWIPVAERLPEELVAVLVWSEYGFCETAVYLGIPGKWRVTWDYTMLEVNSITHWMPLPDDPKEGWVWKSRYAVQSAEVMDL